MKGNEREEDDIDLSNDQWFKENYLDLVQKYPRLWIAVMDQQVICDAGTKSATETKAKKIAGDREFSIYFIEPTALPL
ncbi:MAG TPA: DUF5678 domain-containing protein [Thermoplasmata archaeon]|nr:DUF5678 domain-containing protein [Thermoplasmata archaeon]